MILRAYAPPNRRVQGPFGPHRPPNYWCRVVALGQIRGKGGQDSKSPGVSQGEPPGTRRRGRRPQGSLGTPCDSMTGRKTKLPSLPSLSSLSFPLKRRSPFAVMLSQNPPAAPSVPSTAEPGHDSISEMLSRCCHADSVRRGMADRFIEESIPRAGSGGQGRRETVTGGRHPRDAVTGGRGDGDVEGGGAGGRSR